MGARLDAGVNEVWPAPSATLPVSVTDANVGLVEMSKRYTIGAAGPIGVTLTTVRVGWVDTLAPFGGEMGVGALKATDAPIVNLETALNAPVVPPAVACTCQ